MTWTPTTLPVVGVQSCDEAQRLWHRHQLEAWAASYIPCGGAYLLLAAKMVQLHQNSCPAVVCALA